MRNTRSGSVRLALIAGMCAVAGAGEVRVAVFGLFHPGVLEVEAVRHRPLRVGRTTIAWPDAKRITLQTSLPLVFPEGEFVLRVPGRIERRFEGRLAILRNSGELIAVITMDLETAVASIVAAESPPGAGLESMRAQAVVARSYLVNGQHRHEYSDFCDTTHCQFLREPPAGRSQAARAARDTAGLVLLYQGRPFEALYSADCGGRTRTLADARLTTRSYPYFAVECPVQSGVAEGHRIGLCQRGAAAMDRAGVRWTEILSRYFPATAIAMAPTIDPTQMPQTSGGR